MIEVLVAHPSHKVRSNLSMEISHLDGVDVCGRLRNPSEFFEQVKKKDPDVVLMGTKFDDVSGLDLIDVLLKSDPRPVLVIDDDESTETVKSFSYGAVDFISHRESAEDIGALIELASEVDDFGWASADPNTPEVPSTTGKAVVIGASTGGPGALETVLKSLPGDLPAPVLVAQHMSEGYISNFSKRLDPLTGLDVKKAAEGEIVESGTVYLSPADMDMVVVEQEGDVVIRLAEPDGGETPSIDRLFTSVSEFYGSESVAVVLTGMGEDGVLGARYLQSAGSTLIVQDEQTSAVYGIGNHVVDQGDADRILPIEQIPSEIVRCL